MSETQRISLLLVREIFTPSSTLGKLYINGDYFCYTLEDTVRGEGIKIYGVTAIPQGIYKVRLTYSQKFKRVMPFICNVPLFEGIRLHGGNRTTDTSGCPLIAFNKIDNRTIQGSAEKELTRRLKDFNSPIYISITNNPI